MISPRPQSAPSPAPQGRPPASLAADDSAVGVPARAMVAGVIPPAMLHEDEIVLLLVKPSLWYIPAASLRFVLVVVLLALLTGRLREMTALPYISAQNVAALAALLALGRLVWALLVWTSHIYLLTNQRIVTLKGVLNVAIFQCSLRKVQRTTLYRPLVQRLLGLGTIGFATAATTEFDSTWIMIPRPIQTHEQIVAAINRLQ